MPTRLLQFAMLLILAASGCAGVNRTTRIAGVPLPSERVKQIRELGYSARFAPPDRQEVYAQALARIIHQETDGLIRQEAVKAIANIPGQTTVDALKYATEDHDRDVRREVCAAWKKYNGPESVPALIDILASESDLYIRQDAIEMLGKMGDKQAIRAMIAPLSDSDVALQYYSVVALQQITGFTNDDPRQWLAYCEGQISHPNERLATR